MSKIVIIGAGGHGRVVADIARACGYEEIVFLDDAETQISSGKVSDFKKYKENYMFVVAIGNNDVREKIQKDLMMCGCRVVTLIHPTAVVANNVKVGLGTVVMAGVIINNGAIIGDGVILNTACSVDHDCVVEEYCHISVGVHLAGTVIVGKKTMIGAGATVINNIFICEKCVVGAGTLVLNDIREKGTYVGVPARKIV